MTGTLKAYGRAVVVSHTQTFGKGTVQKVLPLQSHGLPGAIKVTTDRYFLANGSSVQLKGVEPDLVIPGVKLVNDDGYLEAATENAIAWSQIPGKLDPTKPEVKMWLEWKEKNVPILQQYSKVRVDANPEFTDAFDLRKRKQKLDDAAKNAKPIEHPDVLDDKTKKEKDEKDFQGDEGVAIAADMISTWPVVDGQEVATMKLPPPAAPVKAAPEKVSELETLKAQMQKLTEENAKLKDENDKLRKSLTQGEIKNGGVLTK